MGKVNKKSKGQQEGRGLERPPDEAIPAEELRDIIEWQRAQGGPPADLPVAVAEIKKTTKERLEECLGSVLADDAEQIEGDLIEAGVSPTKKDVEKVVELLSGRSGKLIGKIADKLIAEYSEEYISQLLKDGEFDAIVNESADEIKKELDMAVRDCYQEVWQEKKKKGKLTAAQKENGPKMSERIETPTEAGELMLDKSGENPEQKELKEKIKMATREAVDYILGRIDSRINEIKEGVGALINGGINETELLSDRERIKNHILNNLLEGFAGSILRYLGDDYQSPHAEQTIRTEARRMVANTFADSLEINKILPKEKIPREKMPQETGSQEEIDFSKYTGALSERLKERAENAKGQERAETIELLKTWNFVKGNLGKNEQKLMEEMLEEAVMKVYNKYLELEMKEPIFNLNQFNHEFLEGVVEPVLRKEEIKNRDKLDSFRMYFTQAFVVEEIKRK